MRGISVKNTKIKNDVQRYFDRIQLVVVRTEGSKDEPGIQERLSIMYKESESAFGTSQK
jgi:hypothetical protein